MLVIFDCDGVLRSVSWDSMFAAYPAIAEHIKKNPTELWSDIQNFRKWFSNDWHFNLERMGMPKGSDYSIINKIFHEIYDAGIYKFHWVEETLESLSQRHVLAVLSSSNSFSVERSLDVSARHFSCIKGVEHVKNMKPHPEGINLIVREVGARANDTIMIGDSDADILAGKNARVKTIGVTWGMLEMEDMKKLEPDFIFHDPVQLKLV